MDRQERATRPLYGKDTSGGEGHEGCSRDLWVMSSTEARLMWLLFPDGNMIGRIRAPDGDTLGDSLRLRGRV